jgi:hypothetical protein
MDEEHKKQVAVFRFGVIADFVAGARLPRGDRRRLLSEKCARKWTHRRIRAFAADSSKDRKEGNETGKNE